MASLDEVHDDIELSQTYESVEPNFDSITNPSIGGDDASYTMEDNLEEPRDKSEEGKLFLGGLSWDTTEDKLKEHFSKYGDIQDVVVMREPMGGRSRGFGFVHFVSAEMADRALDDSHTIDNKTIDAKKAVPKGSSQRSSVKVTKIFVGGVAPGVTDNEVFECFSKFGTVSSVNIMVDKETNRPRGFAFVEFLDPSSVKAAMAEQEVLIGDKPVDIKPAMPRVRYQTPMGGRPGYQNHNSRMGQSYRARPSYSRYQNNGPDPYSYQKQQYSGSKYGMATGPRPYSQNGYNYGNYQYSQQSNNQHRYQQPRPNAGYSPSGQGYGQYNRYYPSSSSGQAPNGYNARPRYPSRPPQGRPSYGFHPYQR